MEKICPINEQQVIEIDEVYDEICKFDESVRKKQCRRRNRVNKGKKRKNKRITSRIRM